MEYVNNLLEKLRNKQTRDSTSRTYLRVWRQLNKFIINLDYRDNLSWEQKTALFGAYLIEGGIQSSTLKSYFSAIKHVLRLDGYVWDDKMFLLDSLARSCKLVNGKVKIRLPIQKGLFELLLFEMERFYYDSPQPYLESMYKAMFCLTYYGLLRVGEVTLSPHNICASNVHVGNNKDKILIVLYSSKTHGPESRPQKVRIAAAPTTMQNTKIFCPLRIVLKYMAMRGSYLNASEPFFIMSDRTAVKPHIVRNLLRTLLDRIQLDSSLYDVHSFRIGRASDLAKFGYSVEQIKCMGRWKSNAVYRYLRN